MIFYVLSVLAGVAVAFQTGVNSQLRQDTNNPVLTALLSFTTGTIALVALYFIFFYQCLDDEETPFSHFEHYRQKIPQATFREIKSGGHQLNNDLTVVANDIKSMEQKS